MRNVLVPVLVFSYTEKEELWIGRGTLQTKCMFSVGVGRVG